MELNKNEFNAMQGGFKEFIHKHLEMRTLQNLGLQVTEQNVLEIGCGSGYGAELLSAYHPNSYLGIDLMPEQIDLAKQKSIPNSQFEIADATQMDQLRTAPIDEIIVFRILHHIPQWKAVLQASFDKLSTGGSIYIIEPYRYLSKLADLFLDWQHPEEALFTTREIQQEMHRIGFKTSITSVGYGFAMRGTVVR